MRLKNGINPVQLAALSYVRKKNGINPVGLAEPSYVGRKNGINPAELTETSYVRRMNGINPVELAETSYVRRMNGKNPAELAETRYVWRMNGKNPAELSDLSYVWRMNGKNPVELAETSYVRRMNGKNPAELAEMIYRGRKRGENALEYAYPLCGFPTKAPLPPTPKIKKHINQRSPIFYRQMPLLKGSDWMLRIRLNELGKGNDNGLIQADVWKWDGIGWNEYITQQDEDFIRTEEELFVTIPAEAGLYRVDYSNKPFEAPYLLPEWVGDDLRTTGLHPAPFNLKEGTLWGYINDEGRVQIEPRYEYAEDFQKNGLAVVQRKNSSGLIDSTGRERVKPIYSFIAPFSEERAVVSDAKGYTFIDEKGKEVTSARYDYLNSLHEGRALFSKQNTTGGQSLYGYVDAQGKEVLPAIYVDANDFMNGVALVKIKEEEYALIDPAGNILHTYNHPFVGSPGEGLLAYQATENGKYGYLNTDGSVAIQPQFTSALPFSEGRAVVNTAENYGNAYGLIDKQGKMIIPAKYYEVLQLGEGRVAIGTPVFPSQPYRGSRYVIADAETGAVLSNHTLLGVNNYQEGLASVFDAKDTYFIDRSGKKAAQPPVIPGTGTLTLSGRLIRADVDQRTSYYDRQGKQVWRQNGVIPLRPPYSVVEKKYKPNRDYLVYYPVVEGIASAEVSREVNDKLRKLSLAEDVGSGGVSQDFSYNGDFSVSFFRKNLLVLELTGYRFPFGAAHGMPTKIYPHINLRSGRFYKLGDLFKPGSRYVEKLSKIVGKQIENDPQYSYVFPDTYKGITSDQPFFVDNEALYLYFAPYEIAPYSAGFPTFRIPYAEIMGLISTEGEFWQSFH